MLVKSNVAKSPSMSRGLGKVWTETYAECKAETALLDFGEAVVKVHGQFKGIHLIYYKVFEWLADKLIYRGKNRR